MQLQSILVKRTFRSLFNSDNIRSCKPSIESCNSLVESINFSCNSIVKSLNLCVNPSIKRLNLCCDSVVELFVFSFSISNLSINSSVNSSNLSCSVFNFLVNSIVKCLISIFPVLDFLCKSSVQFLGKFLNGVNSLEGKEIFIQGLTCSLSESSYILYILILIESSLGDIPEGSCLRSCRSSSCAETLRDILVNTLIHHSGIIIVSSLNSDSTLETYQNVSQLFRGNMRSNNNESLFGYIVHTNGSSCNLRILIACIHIRCSSAIQYQNTLYIHRIDNMVIMHLCVDGVDRLTSLGLCVILNETRIGYTHYIRKACISERNRSGLPY